MKLYPVTAIVMAVTGEQFMSDFFQNVNPNLQKAAKKIQDDIIEILKGNSKLTEKQLQDFLKEYSYEIAQSFFTDLCYEIKEHGFLLLPLIAMVINRVMESDREDEENDHAALMWICTAVADLKYSTTMKLSDKARIWVSKEIDKQQGE